MAKSDEKDKSKTAEEEDIKINNNESADDKLKVIEEKLLRLMA